MAWKATPQNAGYMGAKRTCARKGPVESHLPGRQYQQVSEGSALEGSAFQARFLPMYLSGHIHSLRSCMYPVSEVLPTRQMLAILESRMPNHR